MEGLSHLSLCKGGLEGKFTPVSVSGMRKRREFEEVLPNGRANREPTGEKQKGETRSPFYQFSQICLLVLPYSALAVSAPIARAYFLPEKRISFSDFLPSLLTVVTAELRSGV